jgi:hypothetical protein
MSDDLKTAPAGQIGTEERQMLRGKQMIDDDDVFDQALEQFKNGEPALRRRAHAAGYVVVRMRGYEYKRRESKNMGAYMLLANDSVVLFHATEAQLEEFFRSRLSPN